MTPIPAEQLIPHRPPMLMLEALVECEPGAARGRTVLSEGHFGVSEGRVLESAAIEAVAQTVAAMIAYNEPAEDAQPGMLAGINGFSFARAPRVGEALEIEVREMKRLGPMMMIHGRVSAAGETIAEGEMKLYG